MGKNVKKKDGANHVKCCGCRIKITKDLLVLTWEVIGDLEENAFLGLNREGRMKRTKKEGGEEVKEMTPVNYLSL